MLFLACCQKSYRKEKYAENNCIEDAKDFFSKKAVKKLNHNVNRSSSIVIKIMRPLAIENISNAMDSRVGSPYEHIMPIIAEQWCKNVHKIHAHYHNNKKNATKYLILNGNLKGNVKGGIYENVVAECLVKKGYTLHYYHPSDNRELEFVIEKGLEVVPIEVKANNDATVSLNEFIQEFKPSIAYKITGGNLGYIDHKYTIPHYMIMFI